MSRMGGTDAITSVCTAAMLASAGQSFAHMQIDKGESSTILFIYGEITKDDADAVAQQTTGVKADILIFNLNSIGGSVDAAIKIGRIVRANESTVSVPDGGKCFSSCALIYIAGVIRRNYGIIGLHRPYLGAALSREAVERAAPLMLQKVKDYVREMGISDAFYDAMVNTEVSDVRLYHGREITKLVPETDPIHDEIKTSRAAQMYGISAAEFRRRDSLIIEQCEPSNDSKESRHRSSNCIAATYWGIDPATYERLHIGETLSRSCPPFTADELNILRATDIRKRYDLPLVIEKETCRIETVKRLLAPVPPLRLTK
jgi:hypothetical protein